MNYDRIYEYRFKGIDAEKKQRTWQLISEFIQKKLHAPKTILDPAAGNCEFINSFPGPSEKWAVDMNEQLRKYASPEVKVIIGNNLQVELPENYFEGVFISNFLEHLESQKEVAFFLERMYKSMKKGGRIAIIGPNFKHVANEYFDFADHTVILSDLGVAEHLYGAGFEIEKIYSRFLPLSFRGRIPVNDFLVRTYLKFPLFWNIMGKQFLIIGRKV